MLNYHLNITICKDLACQTFWHNVRHENDNEINWHFYSFKTFKLSFPCIVPKIDNIFWWLIINSNGYMKFENFQKCHTNGAEYRGQTHIMPTINMGCYKPTGVYNIWGNTWDYLIYNYHIGWKLVHSNF